MNKRWILFMILVIVFVTLLTVVIYVSKDREEIIDKGTKIIYVDAIDRTTRKHLITNFTAVANDTILITSSTRNDSLIEINVTDYGIIDFFPQHPEYYSDKRVLVGGNRITLELSKIGNMTVSHEGTLDKTRGKIKLSISTDISNRQLSLCTRWSQNIIDVTSEEYKQIFMINNQLDCEYLGHNWIEEIRECGFWCNLGFKDANVTPARCEVGSVDLLPPTRLEGKVDRCYFIKKTIKRDKPLVVELDYRAYSTLNEDDFIKFFVLDSDKGLDGLYQFENSEGKDVGAKDFVYIIR